MSRKHEYNYIESEIPSFDWYEKGEKIEHSIPIGGSIILHFNDARIVGVEIYDTNIPVNISEEFRERNGEIEFKTGEEIENIQKEFT